MDGTVQPPPHPGDLCPTPELLGRTLLFCSPDVPPPPPPSGFQNRLDRGRPPGSCGLCRGPCHDGSQLGGPGLLAALPPHPSWAPQVLGLHWGRRGRVPMGARVSQRGTVGVPSDGWCGVSLARLMLGCHGAVVAVPPTNGVTCSAPTLDTQSGHVISFCPHIHLVCGGGLVPLFLFGP